MLKKDNSTVPLDIFFGLFDEVVSVVLMPSLFRFPLKIVLFFLVFHLL